MITTRRLSAPSWPGMFGYGGGFSVPPSFLMGTGQWLLVGEEERSIEQGVGYLPVMACMMSCLLSWLRMSSSKRGSVSTRTLVCGRSKGTL
jgi:hypothetical protein